MNDNYLFTNRLATVSDLHREVYNRAFVELAEFSDKYVKELVSKNLFPRDYPWPIDSLRTWSRWWEYVYVWLQLKRNFSGKRKKIIVDIGSALTFFPFFLASKGFKVIVIDTNQRMIELGLRVKNRLSLLSREQRQGLHHLVADAGALPLADSTCHAISNISVLEHIINKGEVIKDSYRVLGRDGLFICTMDVAYDHLPDRFDSPLKIQDAYDLIRLLETKFAQPINFAFTHPLDELTPTNAPKEILAAAAYLPLKNISWWNYSCLYIWHRYLRQITKLLTSRIIVVPYWRIPFRLAYFLFNPRRLDMWTVMGVAVQKSSMRR